MAIKVAYRTAPKTQVKPKPTPVANPPLPKNRVKKSKLAAAMPTNNSQISVIFRHLKPTWRSYLDYVRVAANDGNQEMQRIIDVYRKISIHEQATIMPEQLCDLAGVRPAHLVGAVCAMLWTGSQQEAAIITSIAHPKIVEKLTKSALTVKGKADREMFLKATGYLPMPKGSSITVQLPPGAQAQKNDGKMLSLPSQEDDVLEIEAVESTPMPLLAAPEAENV